MSDLTTRIRQAMEIRGITRGELERRVGMSKGHVSRVLERGNMEVGTFQAIADALDVTYEWLLRGPPAPFGREEAPRPDSDIAVARAMRDMRAVPAKLEAQLAEPVPAPISSAPTKRTRR